MNERIEKKMQQIEKTERLLKKYGMNLTDDQKEKALTLGWRAMDEYCGRNFDLFRNMDDYNRTYRKLDELKIQLEKIKKQEEKKAAKQATLDDMPEALKEFADKMVKSWSEWDKGYRSFLKKEYKEMNSKYPANSIQGYRDFIEKYKYSGYQFMRITDQEIEETNKKDMEHLILNLLERVTEKTGKITDASGLIVTSGNQGYAVINGLVIGENGNAVVESIGAGGYNIQRYHIRTLVK